MSIINSFISKLDSKGLKTSINLDRPNYVQPEDLISYRSIRIVIILGRLNNQYGVSKDIVACVDFLLRNEPYQMKFIAEYYKDKKILSEKLNKLKKANDIEIDFNIVQYRSIPWDLRFNDMFMYLYSRKIIQFIDNSDKKNTRMLLSDEGRKLFEKVAPLFPNEINFLELFGTRFSEEKTVKIITEIIPNTYWNQK